MAGFPTYTMSIASVEMFLDALRSKGACVEKTSDHMIIAQGSYYREYAAIFENGGKLVFWTHEFPSETTLTLTIGNQSCRKGRAHLESALELLDVSGIRLGKIGKQ